MKAIDTEYHGYRFRSRLEARWAVFFDACGVKWEYEPEGFNLGDGIYYLPDFLLHDVLFRGSDTPHDLWVEVKGQMTDEDAKKIIKFANVRSDENGILLGVDNPTLVVTNIPDGDDVEDYMRNLAYKGDEPYPFNFALIDGDYFGAFPFVNKQGRLVIADDNQRCAGGHDYDATEKAYRLARQARFEHGEKPQISKGTYNITISDRLLYFIKITTKYILNFSKPYSSEEIAKWVDFVPEILQPIAALEREIGTDKIILVSQLQIPVNRKFRWMFTDMSCSLVKPQSRIEYAKQIASMIRDKI